jgi:P-type conjugative transfer protein TrbJ
MHKHLYALVKSMAPAAFAAAMLLIPAREAEAQWVVSDPSTEVNTWLTYAKQLQTYIQEVQTGLTAVQHLQLAVNEARQLATHPSTNVLQDLNMFMGVVQQSQGLALNLAQMDNTFRNQFQIYSPSPLISYASQYNTWATTALQAVHAAANSAGYQGNMLQNEQQFMQQMNLLNQSPAGQDQAIQITNSIGLETVAQLQKLRMLFVQNMAQDAAVSTAALNTQQSSVQAINTGFGQANWQADQRAW